MLTENIDGIEVFSSYHSHRMAEHYMRIALQNRLLVTCGSDFHGKHKPQIRIGGHGAFWEDDKLMAEGKAWFSKTFDGW